MLRVAMCHVMLRHKHVKCLHIMRVARFGMQERRVMVSADTVIVDRVQKDSRETSRRKPNNDPICKEYECLRQQLPNNDPTTTPTMTPF